MSAEPSMEEILSSIKRIIAEEETPAGRRRAAVRPVADRSPDMYADDEVLELSDPIPPHAVEAFKGEAAVSEAAAVTRPAPAAQIPPHSPSSQPEAIVSPAAIDATRGSLDSLSRLLIRPEPNGDGTLEGLVREMLRPMLRDWLDANLPAMVETMVAREIARISNQPR